MPSCRPPMSWIASTICSGIEPPTGRPYYRTIGGWRKAPRQPMLDETHDFRPSLRARARLLRLRGVRLAPAAVLRPRLARGWHGLRDRRLLLPGGGPRRGGREPPRRARLHGPVRALARLCRGPREHGLPRARRGGALSAR